MNPLQALRAMWDRVLAGVLAAVGIVLLVVGWKRVSDTPFPAEQLPYMISAGIGGLCVLGAAATMWISAHLRDEWHKLDDIDGHLASIQEQLETDT